MHVLHPVILLVIVVAAFVSLRLPASKKESLSALGTGLAFGVFAFVTNAVFQWEHPSPMNLILMNEQAGTFEVILLSIAYACILRGFVGLLRHGWRTLRSPRRGDADAQNS